MIKFLKKYYPLIIFLFALGFFAVNFYLVRSFMTNFDEMDHISAVYLMSQGQKLYTNIFATHFPFPFYWANLFSSFWANAPFAKAITNLHFSLAIFYLLTFIFTFFALKKPSFKLIFSVWIIFLTLILSLYHGNLFLSETFTGILISAVFWLLLPYLFSKEKPDFYSLSLLVIFSSLAVWTQPLLIFLLLIPLLISNSNQRLKIFLLIFLINLLPILGLLISGQFFPFFKQAVVFNNTVYSHNFPEQVGNHSMFLQNFLDFFKHQFFLLTHFFTSTQIYQFILNLILLIFSFFVLFKSKLIYKISFLILFLSLMSRQIKVTPGSIFNFGSYPILLFSFICLLALFYQKISKVLTVILILVCFITVIHDYSPIFRQSLNPAYNYQVFWSYKETTGQMIDNLTLSSEKILIYPHDPDYYFFSKRLPVDRFTYWYPWYDQVPEYKQERLTALKNTPPALIYLGSLGYKDNSNAYGQFFPDLLKNYLPVFKDQKSTPIWLRADLKDRIKFPYSLTGE